MINIKRTIFITAILGILIAPSFSSAITVAEIQAQLNAILLKVQELQSQLSQYSSGTSPSPSPAPSSTPPPTTGLCHTFNTNLKYGDTGTEVQALQTALEKEGFVISAAEKSSLSFLDSTASAVTGFQEKYMNEILTPLALQHGTGYVGNATRTKLNSLYGCASQPTPPSTPAASTGILKGTATCSVGSNTYTAYGEKQDSIYKVQAKLTGINNCDSGLNNTNNITCGTKFISPFGCAGPGTKALIDTTNNTITVKGLDFSCTEICQKTVSMLAVTPTPTDKFIGPGIIYTPPPCGDGKCETGESGLTCSADCKVYSTVERNAQCSSGGYTFSAYGKYQETENGAGGTTVGRYAQASASGNGSCNSGLQPESAQCSGSGFESWALVESLIGTNGIYYAIKATGRINGQTVCTNSVPF